MRKVCTKCRESKPLTDYHKNKKSKLGVKSYCKACYRRMYQSRSDKVIQTPLDRYKPKKDELFDAFLRVEIKHRKHRYGPFVCEARQPMNLTATAGGLDWLLYYSEFYFLPAKPIKAMVVRVS